MATTFPQQAISSDALEQRLEGDIFKLHEEIQKKTKDEQDKTGTSVMIGWEWEFQVIRPDGGVMDDREKEVFAKDLAQHLNLSKSLGYELKVESGTNQFELVTGRSVASFAPILLQRCKTEIADYLQQKGYQLSTRAFDNGATNTLHVNVSLAKGKQQIMRYKRDFTDDGQRLISPTGADIVEGMMEVSEQTPLWTATSEDSFKRFSDSHLDPKGFYAHFGKDHEAAFNIREISDFTALDGVYGFRIENRIPDADTHPHIAVFQTLLGVCHGLSKRTFLDPESHPTVLYVPNRRPPGGRKPMYKSIAEARDAQQHGTVVQEYVDQGVVAKETIDDINAYMTAVRRAGLGSGRGWSQFGAI